MEVLIVQYQGAYLIVPANFSRHTVFEYAKAGLKACPDARKILWNDVVREIEVSGDSFLVKL